MRHRQAPALLRYMVNEIQFDQMQNEGGVQWNETILTINLQKTSNGNLIVSGTQRLIKYLACYQKNQENCKEGKLHTSQSQNCFQVHG